MIEKRVRCLDCGSFFGITEEEQKYFTSRGFFTPKRCPECRGRRRSQKARFNNNYRTNNNTFNTESNTLSKPQKTYHAKCFACGTPTSVNFRPSYARPAFCSGCNQGRYRKRRY